MSGAEGPSRRVVLLGASNLARSLPTLLDVLSQVFPEEKLDLLLAHGHGRSYGKASSVPGRTLPAILDCGLWRALEERPILPTYALLTDVGNDLAYGLDVETLANWVALCLKRLARHRADLTLTGLPITRLARLEPWQLHLAQWFFFPMSKHQDWLSAQKNVWSLERHLRDLATTHQARFVEQHSGWYGIDPIHLRGKDQWRAFKTYFATWNRSPTESRQSSIRRWRRRLWSWTLVPEQRWLFGVEQARHQPSSRLGCGGWLSIF